MKAIDAVANLRALANLLEKHGDADVNMVTGSVWFDDKEQFLSVSKDFPRPAKKDFETWELGNLCLTHGALGKTGFIELKILRSSICELVAPARPAEYRCKPLFSDKEEKEMGVIPCDPLSTFV
jgi:hypothetical protein